MIENWNGGRWLRQFGTAFLAARRRSIEDRVHTRADRTAASGRVEVREGQIRCRKENRVLLGADQTDDVHADRTAAYGTVEQGRGSSSNDPLGTDHSSSTICAERIRTARTSTLNRITIVPEAAFLSAWCEHDPHLHRLVERNLAFLSTTTQDAFYCSNL